MIRKQNKNYNLLNYKKTIKNQGIIVEIHNNAKVLNVNINKK